MRQKLTALLSDMRLYRRLVGMQMRAQLQYRAHLALDILTTLTITVLEFMAVLLYFAAFPTILGWHVGEVALLAAITALNYGVADLAGSGIDAFDTLIRRGDFDRVLLRPMDVFIQVIASEFRLRRLGRVIYGCLLFALALHLLPQLRWTPAKLLSLPIGIVTGATIFVAIMVLGATSCFWTVETTELTNILTDGGREMLNYPITIYHQALQRVFFFVVPLAFGSYAPTCYILGRPLPFGLPAAIIFAGPLIAVAFASMAGAIWRVGVRHYQSTGS